MMYSALLHPNISPDALQPFQQVSELAIQSNIQENASAALIFGGDGTIHRHLPQLFQYKIPALVVPKGSGNDFAMALGIWNERSPLATWKHFCAHGNNVTTIDLALIHNDSHVTLS